MSAVIQQPVVKLRPMRESDIDAVMAIETRCYEFPWTTGIFRDCLRVGYCCWVLQDAGEMVAYGVMSVGAGESHILNICVAPHARGAGYGEMMMKHLVHTARRHGSAICLLEVRPSNHAAIALYRKLGFLEVGSRKAYYPAHDGREDALILAVEL